MNDQTQTNEAQTQTPVTTSEPAAMIPVTRGGEVLNGIKIQRTDKVQGNAQFPLTKKGEIAYLKRDDDDNIVSPHAAGKKWPTEFPTVAAFNEAVGELAEIRAFNLSSNFPFDMTDEQDGSIGPVTWNFGAGKEGQPGNIYALVAPSTKEVIEDASLLSLVVPAGIKDNLTRLLREINRRFKNDKDTGVIFGLDLSPANILRAVRALDTAKRGEKARQTYATFIWRSAVGALRNNVNSRQGTVQQPRLQAMLKVVDELDMPSQNPELCMRLVSTCDGISKTFDGTVSEKVLSRVDKWIEDTLAKFAALSPDEKGKITYYTPKADAKRKNPLTVNKSDAEGMSVNRANTFYSDDAAVLSDDEFEALFTEAPAVEADAETTANEASNEASTNTAQ